MRFSGLLRLGAAAYATAAVAQEEPCGDGTCAAPPKPAAEHLLLQINRRHNVTRKSGGPPDSLVWSDEFDGSGAPDRAKWVPETGGWGFGNNELQYYTDKTDNAYVDQGTLKIVAKCESYNGKSFTSAKLTTEHTATWGPGHRVEVRAKLPINMGTWPAIWMLPKDSVFGGWPRSGEIDILETVGCSPGKIYGTVHTEAFNHVIHTEKQGVLDLAAADWQVYAIDWQADHITWSVNGRDYFTFTPPDLKQHQQWPFDREFYLILNVAVGGSWGGWCLQGGWPSCSKQSEFGSPQVMEVDYVRIYQTGGSLAQE